MFLFQKRLIKPSLIRTKPSASVATRYRKRLNRLFPLCLALSIALHAGAWRYRDLWPRFPTGPGIRFILTGRSALELEIAPPLILAPTQPRFHDKADEPETRFQDIAVTPPQGTRAPHDPLELAAGQQSALAGVDDAGHESSAPEYLPAEPNMRSKIKNHTDDFPDMPETRVALLDDIPPKPAFAVPEPEPTESRFSLTNIVETAPLAAKEGVFAIDDAPPSAVLDTFAASPTRESADANQPTPRRDDARHPPGRKNDKEPDLGNLELEPPEPIKPTPRILSRWNVDEARFAPGGGLGATLDPLLNEKPAIAPLDAAPQLDDFARTDPVALSDESGQRQPERRQPAPPTPPTPAETALVDSPRPVVLPVAARYTVRGWGNLRKRAELIRDLNMTALPPETAGHGRTGRAIVRTVIGVYGACLEAEIIFSSGSATLDDAILEAVRKAEYVPAVTRDGVPAVAEEWFDVRFSGQ